VNLGTSSPNVWSVSDDTLVTEHRIVLTEADGVVLNEVNTVQAYSEDDSSPRNYDWSDEAEFSATLTDVAVVLTGVSATAAAGTMSVTADALAALTGASASGQA